VPDMDRAAATRFVYQRLIDPMFRQYLRAAAQDGSHPVIVALKDDLIDTLIGQVLALGGVSNVVIPTLNGVVIIAMGAEVGETITGTGAPPRLRSDCTVGVFFERLKMDLLGADAAIVYQFAVDGPGIRVEHGSAEVVALAD
jgi:hypothetical protein